MDVVHNEERVTYKEEFQVLTRTAGLYFGLFQTGSNSKPKPNKSLTVFSCYIFGISFIIIVKALQYKPH